MSEAAAQPRRRGRRLRGFVALLLLAIFAGAWTGLYGVFELGEEEFALISRAGKLVRKVEGPGRFFHLPFPLERRSRMSRGPATIPQGRVSLVTADAQLLEGVYRGSYRIAEASAARFGVRDPVETVDGAIRSAVVATAAAQDRAGLQALAPATLAAQVQREAELRLRALGAGFEVLHVELDLSLPEAVTALEDEIAGLNEEREREQAAARRDGDALLARARVGALDERQRAESDRIAQISKAQGEAERFRAVAAEYRKAPELVKTRIYLETMEEILSKARVIVAAPGAPIPAASPSSHALPPVSSGRDAKAENQP